MLNKLAPNVFWMPPDHTTDRPVVAAVAGADATLMVEAGNSFKHARLFLDLLANENVPPVRYVVIQHAHWDHVFGASDIDAVTISTVETQREVATMASYSWSDAAIDERVASGLEIPFCRDMMKAELAPDERALLKIRVPELAFKTEMVVELGDQAVQLIHVGGDHASDSCIVVVPGVVAFLSDCLYRNLHTEPNFLTRRRLYPLLDRLLALRVDFYVLGHDETVYTRDAFAALAHDLRWAGDMVERHELNHGAIERALPELETVQPPSEILETVKAFQAGLVYEAD